MSIRHELWNPAHGNGCNNQPTLTRVIQEGICYPTNGDSTMYWCNGSIPSWITYSTSNCTGSPFPYHFPEPVFNGECLDYGFAAQRYTCYSNDITPSPVPHHNETQCFQSNQFTNNECTGTPSEGGVMPLDTCIPVNGSSQFFTCDGPSWMMKLYEESPTCEGIPSQEITGDGPQCWGLTEQSVQFQCTNQCNTLPTTSMPATNIPTTTPSTPVTPTIPVTPIPTTTAPTTPTPTTPTPTTPAPTTIPPIGKGTNSSQDSTQNSGLIVGMVFLSIFIVIVAVVLYLKYVYYPRRSFHSTAKDLMYHHAESNQQSQIQIQHDQDGIQHQP